MSEDIDWDNGSFLHLVHGCLLVDESWSHEVSSFENEFEGSFIGCEARVHVWVCVDGFEDGNAVLLYEEEVVLLIYDYVFHFMLFSCFDFVDDGFGFFGEEDTYLFLGKLRPFVETCSELFNCRFTG